MSIYYTGCSSLLEENYPSGAPTSVLNSMNVKKNSKDGNALSIATHLGNALQES